MRTFILYYNTIKYLKFSQIVHQILKRLGLPKKKATFKVLKLRRIYKPPKKFLKKRQSLYEESQFQFFGITENLLDVGWSGQQVNDLWRYNQHYFDDLQSDPKNQRLNSQLLLLDTWIRDNPISSRPGWDPYPTSLRIVNWIKFDLVKGLLSEKQRSSLYSQAFWLNQNIELHLLGNHLLANAKAMIYAGLFFDDANSMKWLKKGLKIYEQQVDEQILDDGAHFELSPMYHSIILEDMLDIINLFDTYGPVPNTKSKFIRQVLKKKVSLMLAWLNKMTHPDGMIAFFNDSALDLSPKLNQLAQYAASLGINFKMMENYPVKHLKSSGFFVWREDQNYLIMDAGKVGPNYIPGHAHADTLSLECSINRERVIVNSGISEYQIGDLRAFQRSTAAHSTLVINNENSSEVWGAFRVADRAQIIESYFDRKKNGFIISGTHDGYKKINGSFIHKRTLNCSRNEITVTDNVSPSDCSKIDIYYHLGPKIRVVEIDQLTFLLTSLNNAVEATIEFYTGTVKLEDSWWYPTFGKKIKNFTLINSYDGVLPKEFKTKLTWV